MKKTLIMALIWLVSANSYCQVNGLRHRADNYTTPGYISLETNGNDTIYPKRNFIAVLKPDTAQTSGKFHIYVNSDVNGIIRFKDNRTPDHYVYRYLFAGAFAAINPYGYTEVQWMRYEYDIFITLEWKEEEYSLWELMRGVLKIHDIADND